MADEVYWIHKLKLNPGVTEAEFEKHAREELNLEFRMARGITMQESSGAESS